MSSKKMLRLIQNKQEKRALERLLDRFNLQEFNIDIENGHVKAVSIKFKNLTAIPPEIDALLELESLDLSRNQIKKIEGLVHLAKLQKLFLRENQIEKIESLDTLLLLRELDLSDNKISKIEGLLNLRNLEVLELSRNRIKKIEEIERCNYLRVLKLNSNPIELMENLETNTKLEILYLTRTLIKKIRGLENCNVLRELNLAFNQITKIEGLQGCIMLRQLFLNDNQIYALENLENLVILQELSLERNQITPADLPYVTKSAQEIVKYCKLKTEKRRKNEEFKKEVKKKRDRFQIDEELGADTVLQKPEDTKKLREQMMADTPEASEKAQNPEPNEAILSSKAENNESRTAGAAKVADKEAKLVPSYAFNFAFRGQTEPNLSSQDAKAEEKSETEPQATPQVANKQVVKVFPELKKEELESFEKDAPESTDNLAPKPIPREITNPYDGDGKKSENSLPKKDSGPVPVPNPQIEPVMNQIFTTEKEWQKFGISLIQKDNNKDALKAFRNVLQLNTKNLQAWMYSGIAFNNKKDYRRAIRAFKQGLAINPKHAQMWLYLGISYFNSAEYEDATKAFTETLKFEPKNAIALAYMDKIPHEFKQNLDFLEKQAELLAQGSAKIEDQLLRQVNRFTNAYEEMTFAELLPHVLNPPHITDIASLKEKLTDLILEGRLRAKLFIDHLQFIHGTAEAPTQKKVDIERQFSILKLLAFTNFSKLWLVEDPKTKQRTVLKMIIFKDHGEMAKAKLAEQMALREIALISRINSPNVVTLINAFQGEYQGEAGYVLQIPYYINGTLEKRIKEVKADFDRTSKLMPAKAILGIFIGLLRGIIAIHEANIIHRDIKPSNIIVDTDHEIPEPKDVIIIDFGIATAPKEITGMDFTIVGGGAGIGTFGFSAPEQLQSAASVDFNADIFAVGATIYYLLTLNRYPGQFYLTEYVNRYYTPISYIFPILRKMLMNNPAERCSGIDELKKIIKELNQMYKQL